MEWGQLRLPYTFYTPEDKVWGSAEVGRNRFSLLTNSHTAQILR